MEDAVHEERVVGKLTTVVSDRHVPGGVNIVVSAPLFAAAKIELKLPFVASDASVSDILSFWPVKQI
jgi:hypothetical protein